MTPDQLITLYHCISFLKFSSIYVDFNGFLIYNKLRKYHFAHLLKRFLLFTGQRPDSF